MATAEETNLLELKEILVDIQITVSNILCENTKLANEVAELCNAFQQQKGSEKRKLTTDGNAVASTSKAGSKRKKKTKERRSPSQCTISYAQRGDEAC